jgi:PAS domain S-box-containing protein
MKKTAPEQTTRAGPQEALEERLHESERRLRELQRIANVGSWDWNVATGELWWSDQVYVIFGLDPAGLAASHEIFLKSIHPDDLDAVEQAVQRVLDGEAIYDIRHRITLPDGSVRYVRERGEAVRDETGAAVRMFGTVQDVTERYQSERAVEKSESRLAAIIETAPEAVIVTDPSGMIEVFNRGAEDIFGFTPDEALGQPLDILIPQELRTVHRKQMADFENSDARRSMMDVRREISGLRKDGTVFPAAASVAKIEIDGEMVFVAILRDVSELKKAERNLRGALREAEKANRAKSEFLATMSHELRTPLNAILGFSEILRSECLGEIGNRKYAEYADHIFDSGDYLLSLVNDLLDFSAIEDGRRALELESVNLHRVVHDCVNILKEKAQTKDIELICNVAPDLVDIQADRRAMQQVLLNLLSNSIKFTAARGTVQISCLAVGSEIRLAVADTGVGISSEVLPMLTNPFRYFTKNPYRSEEGWGLGLSISKSLVDLHCGVMQIDSEVGKGTTVTVTLPVEGPDGCDECRPPPAA